MSAIVSTHINRLRTAVLKKHSAASIAKWITENTTDSVDTFLPQTLEELEKIQKGKELPGMEDAIPVLPDRVDPEKVEGEMIKEKIISLVDANPHKAALILRDWLVAGAPAPKEEGAKDKKDKSASG